MVLRCIGLADQLYWAQMALREFSVLLAILGGAILGGAILFGLTEGGSIIGSFHILQDEALNTRSFPLVRCFPLCL